MNYYFWTPLFDIDYLLQWNFPEIFEKTENWCILILYLYSSHPDYSFTRWHIWLLQVLQPDKCTTQVIRRQEKKHLSSLLPPAGKTLPQHRRRPKSLLLSWAVLQEQHSITHNVDIMPNMISKRKDTSSCDFFTGKCRMNRTDEYIRRI